MRAFQWHKFLEKREKGKYVCVCVCWNSGILRHYMLDSEIPGCWIVAREPNGWNQSAGFKLLSFWACGETAPLLIYPKSGDNSHLSTWRINKEILWLMKQVTSKSAQLTSVLLSLFEYNIFTLKRNLLQKLTNESIITVSEMWQKRSTLCKSKNE